MRYSEARQGRTFVIRLENGDVLHETIEQFAARKGIKAAIVLAVGGADTGSTLIVGPEHGRSRPIVPMSLRLEGVHELAGTGTLFPNASGRPVLHMHAACGREGRSVTGCVRAGVVTWHVLEVILTELTGTAAARLPDKATGFSLLEPEGPTKARRSQGRYRSATSKMAGSVPGRRSRT